MNNFERSKQPAKSYELNVAASLTSRHNNPNLTEKDIGGLNQELDTSIDFLSREDTPLIPHSDPALALEFGKFVKKLEAMLNSNVISEKMSESRRKRLLKLLKKFNQQLYSLSSINQSENWVSKEEIEQMFKFQKIWEQGEGVVRDEISRWSEKVHPEVPETFISPVEIEETERLIGVMKSVVLGYNMPLFTRIALIENPSDYYLFWSLTMEGSDYVTPATYSLDTQFSFDIPHNVAHLAHLSRIRDRGIQGYIDDMATRAFFESVAVFSEYQIVDRLSKDSSVSLAIRAALSQKRNITPSDLSEWIIKDRSYEFNLRNARLLADLLAVEGVPLNEVVHTVAQTLNIPIADTYKEITKYFPWTGLGAMYTLGYRRLQESGVTSVGELLSQDNIPTTWNEFETMQKKSNQNDVV